MTPREVEALADTLAQRLAPDAEPDGNHQLVVRVVVFTLAALAVLLYTGAMLLTAAGRTVPGELWLGAGTATGALASLLVSSKSTTTALAPAVRAVSPR